MKVLGNHSTLGFDFKDGRQTALGNRIAEIRELKLELKG